MGLLLIPIPLPISAQHAITAARLPPVLRDPFDRMLVLRPSRRALTLVTRPQCQRYDVDVQPV
jgi:PIN domain nuclease of toxin-antitoxin system